MKKWKFNGAFQLESVDRWMQDRFDDDHDLKMVYNGLLKLLSSFIVESDLDLGGVKMKGPEVLLVYHNIITRGFPTWASYELEKEFSKKFKDISPIDNLGSLGFRFSGDNEYSDLFINALHIIEPRINRKSAFSKYLASWERHGSEFEERFLYKELPDRADGDYLIQMMEPQRSLESMVENKVALLEMETNFREQKADFVIEYPHLLRQGGKRGICIEIDGSQHEEESQRHLDQKRNSALSDSNWVVRRIKTSEFNDAGLNEHFEFLYKAFEQDYFQTIKSNYQNPLYSNEKGLAAMELILSPIAIARIQLILLKVLITNEVSISNNELKLLVIERDVPCAELAIKDFQNFIDAFESLLGKSLQVPEISLKVYSTKEFKNSKLRIGTAKNLEQISDKNAYDLVIDISMLERFGITKQEINLKSENYILIRSAYSSQNNHEFLSGKLINWESLLAEDGTESNSVNGLRFFLQNIFRKQDFRPGQLPILNRALRNKTVIGLLPTGGGKSLTYQLAGLLQPGHMIIIDPIKSLMKDQVDGLARMKITGTVYINSSLKTFQEREAALKKLTSGKALFCFISPERLMIENFRRNLMEMKENHRYFSYGVIDEVHCVSEWGHDFRTSYLSLGRNLISHCQTWDLKKPISLFGLTATASYDVLSDVQRELSGETPETSIDDEAIVRHETTNRNEVQLVVEKVEIPEDQIEQINRQAVKDKFGIDIKSALGVLKQKAIVKNIQDASKLLRNFSRKIDEVVTDNLIELTYIKDLPKSEDIFSKIQLDSKLLEGDFWNPGNAAIVFAPHRSWYFGVTDRYTGKEYRNQGIYEMLMKEEVANKRIGTFIGVNAEDEQIAQRIEDDNLMNQDNFIANKLNIMVATKAFGMGIDKPNIRLTVHNSYPGSIESFIQEAGRSGRDGKMAVSIILFNDQKIIDKDNPDVAIENDFQLQETFFNNSFKGEKKEKAIIFELLNEVSNPKKKRTDEIANLLNKRYSRVEGMSKLTLNYSPKYHNLFVNDAERNKYGYIRTRSKEKVIEGDGIEQGLANEVLDFALESITEMNPPQNLEDLHNWYQEEFKVDPTPGIERQLSEIDVNQEYSIVIPFTNNFEKVTYRLAGLLNKIFPEINPQICDKSYAPDLEEFLERLGKTLKKDDLKKELSIQVGDEEELGTLYEKIQYALDSKREKADTEKAIYRLTTIGVIDDYTVDYNAETFAIKGRKKTNEEYHDHLRNYISKYYSKGRTERIIERLPERMGNSEIQRILNFVIEFVYKEVAKKRYEAIKAMKQCCLVGLSKGNVEMKTWIHLYFNSKYARKGYSIEVSEAELDNLIILPSKIIDGEQDLYNASLSDWTDEGKIEEFDFVLDFMRIVEIDEGNSQRDNLKHLRGACTRLLIPNPDNFVLRLLRAFTVMVLEEDNFVEKTKSSVASDLDNGFENLLKFYENNNGKFSKDLAAYLEVLLLQLNNNEVREWIESEIELNLFFGHARWTDEFTNSYTSNLIK